VEIDKESVLKLIREQTGPDRADEAEMELPDKIDSERDARILLRYGIDPQDLTGGILGRGDDLSQI